MAGVYKTPGVYIVEKSAFPNSVVEVATAVPAFIGYTEKANNKGDSLLKKPWRITSLAEYEDYFGKGPKDVFNIVEVATDADGKVSKKTAEKTATTPAADDQGGGATPAPAPTPGTAKKDDDVTLVVDFTLGSSEYTLQRPNEKADTNRYYLYRSMQLFFQNGGGACYVVSVGGYKDVAEIDKTKLTDGIDLLLKEQEPTMLVIPDAMALDQPGSIALQQAMLTHCGGKMKNRFAILDIHDGFQDLVGGGPVKAFRNDLGINNLDFAAAYYPWLNATIVDTNELDLKNIDDRAALKKLLLDAHGQDVSADLKTQIEFLTPTTKTAAAGTPGGAPADTPTDTPAAGGDTPAAGKDTKDTKETVPPTDDELHKILFSVSKPYGRVLAAIQRKLNLLPPSAAMAGVYTMVDNSRGVWKAPANVSLAAVVSPAVSINHDQQEDLNVTTAGKSINAIRSFIGEGVLVWGARTLDGNSLDWRYINVRRTMIMIEESLRLATKAYVFEPNVSGTWVTIKGMANNFLTSVWKRGGLAGASPEDAFSVSVGLGETMTAEDILEGILRVTILVAVSRPAEFIEITFQQQMQKS